MVKKILLEYPLVHYCNYIVELETSYSYKGKRFISADGSHDSQSTILQVPLVWHLVANTLRLADSQGSTTLHGKREGACKFSLKSW